MKVWDIVLSDLKNITRNTNRTRINQAQITQIVFSLVNELNNKFEKPE